MDIWKTAVYASISTAAFFVLIYASSWVAQIIWAWVDDSKIGKQNVAAEWFRKNMGVFGSKWKYPVYNGDYYPGKEIFGYAKDKKLDKENCHGLEEGEDYVYTFERIHPMLGFAFILSFLPFIVAGCFNYPYVFISLALFFSSAHIMRFVRRISKKLKAHESDKNAHKEKEEKK